MVLAALTETMFPFFLVQVQELELELELLAELSVQLEARRLLCSERSLLLLASL